MAKTLATGSKRRRRKLIPEAFKKRIWIEGDPNNAGNVVAHCPAYTLRKHPETKKLYRPVYEITVDTSDLEVHCECEAFRFKHARFHPTLSDKEHHCKHIADWTMQLAMAVVDRIQERARSAQQEVA